jgi:dTDP-4-amino-4,6-dideoxygalactose transaminase
LRAKAVYSSGIEFIPEALYGRSNCWLTAILINPKEFGANWQAVRLALEAENIESRPIWKPRHMQPVFEITQGARGIAHSDSKRHKARVVGGKVSEDLFERGLCLPSGTQITDEDLSRVVTIIRNCHKPSKTKLG